MLPYSPLHHLLMRECAFPVVATSGNLSDEPIAIDNDEAHAAAGRHRRRVPDARPPDRAALRRLGGARGARPRERAAAGPRLRAAAGARRPNDLPPVLAVGGHLKNTVAIAVGRQVFVSQHVGDLDTLEARGAFERAIDDLCRLYRFRPETGGLRSAPGLRLHAMGARLPGCRSSQVQHHHAHVAACAAENDVHGRVSRRRVGRHRLRHGRHDLGRRVLPGGAAAVSSAWRTCARSGCPAARRRSARAGARRRACCYETVGGRER